MGYANVILSALGFCGIGLLATVLSSPVRAQNKRTVIAASTMFDGRGKVVRDTRIVVEGSKIVGVDAKAGPVDYDLRGLVAMPGWIDSHVHITWSFGKDGKNAGYGGLVEDAERGGTEAEKALRAASNAWVTLMAGFTTVQSVGSPADLPLRDAIAQRLIPGPRILTAVEPLIGQGEKSGTPEEIRAYVRNQKQAGADLIKIFANYSPRMPALMLSPEQLSAVCDEASKQGLRVLVHAFKDAVRAATLAGCTEIEHGALATDDDLKLMAEKGVYLDPQAGLVYENYLQNKERFIGTPGFTEQSFTVIPTMIPIHHEFLRRAAKIPGLKIVFGTDALAGSHGRNAEEFVERVQDCGVEPMTAMVSANSLAAEAMRMSDQIGSIAPGLQADIIALDGDPRTDITAVRRVVFVMRGGVVYKNEARSPVRTPAGPNP